MSNPMPGPPPIRDGETWEDYVYRCRRLGETIRQAEARLIEARLIEADATPPEPTTCTCEGDVEWNEGVPHWTPITRDCPEHQEDDQ